nr:hypothetical protein BaRGS_032551 [Batillaria attramentaria]
MTHPVDRGWAWVVLVASLGNRYVSGALVYLVGVIHVELLNKFHKNATTTAWAGAIFSSLQMLGGPLATWFVDNYGCRITMVTGAVLLCAGFTASAFAPSISVLVVTYGLIAGTGLALTYAPVFLVISFNFSRLLGLASGLKVNALHLSVFLSAASAISTSLFPLYSGTYLGQMVFACLFGLSTGGFNTLINVLTVELVGFGDTLAMAYGMGVFVMGVGYVAGPPLAGLAMFAAAVFDLLAKVVHTPHTTDRQVTGIVKMESSEAVDTLLPKGN